jgi:hypothetical protein
MNFTHHGLSYGKKNVNSGGSVAHQSAFSFMEKKVELLRIYFGVPYRT